MIDRIWLPDPREDTKSSALNNLRNFLLTNKGKIPIRSLSSCEEKKFAKEFRKCAEEFDYSQYLNQNYYKKIPTSGYKVTDILGK